MCLERAAPLGQVASFLLNSCHFLVFVTVCAAKLIESPFTPSSAWFLQTNTSIFHRSSNASKNLSQFSSILHRHAAPSGGGGKMPVVLLPCRPLGQHMTATSATCCQNMATGQGKTLHILVGIVWCWSMLSPFWIAEQQLVTFHSHLQISTSRNYMFFRIFSFASSSRMKLSFRVYKDLSQWPEGVISTRLLWLEWPTSRW